MAQCCVFYSCVCVLLLYGVVVVVLRTFFLCCVLVSCNAFSLEEKLDFTGQDEKLILMAISKMSNLKQLIFSNSSLSDKLTKKLVTINLPKLVFLAVHKCPLHKPAPLIQLAYKIPDLKIEYEGNSFKSLHSRVQTQITFHNVLDIIVTIFWENWNARMVPYKQLKPGQFYTQSTYHTHPWTVIGAKNEIITQCVGHKTGPLYVKIGQNVPGAKFPVQQSLIPLTLPNNVQRSFQLRIFNFTTSSLTVANVNEQGEYEIPKKQHMFLTVFMTLPVHLSTSTHSTTILTPEFYAQTLKVEVSMVKNKLCGKFIFV